IHQNQLTPVYVQMAVGLQEFLLITFDRQVLLTVNQAELVSLDVQMVVPLDQFLLVFLDDDVEVAWIIRGLSVPNHELHATFDVLFLMALHVQVFVLEDLLALVAVFSAVLFGSDDQVAIVDYALHAVVLDPLVHVALGVDEDFLFSLGVVEAPLVETLAAG